VKLNTFQDNVYPVGAQSLLPEMYLQLILKNQGCSSDIAIHFYSLSTDLKSDWNDSHAYQPEIQAYWSRLTDKYALFPHIVFNCQVVSVDWDAKKQLYLIVTKDVKTGTQTTTTAKVVISALGILEIPRFPDIQGISAFKGDIFHSARWDTGVDLRGKRVAVIGNGASA